MRFGERAARAVVIDDRRRRSQHRARGRARAGRPKLLKVDGARRERLGRSRRRRPLVCVFMPDRLELVKGPAGVAARASRRARRRAVAGPARDARASYARALAQRNALLGAGARRRRRARLARRLEPRAGAARHRADARPRRLRSSCSSPHFAERGRELGLPGPAALAYRPRSQRVERRGARGRAARARSTADLERGFTTHGPHRDDSRFEVGGRDAAPLRLAGPAAARPARPAAGRARRARGGARRAAGPAARRRPERARPSGARGCCETCSRAGPDADHDRGPGAARWPLGTRLPRVRGGRRWLSGGS